ncbi:calaxin-like [Culicoides brevitarsis]|uniref:calaxin-like n=1 Tax=Culicoides brevitarsis TaxID=469753 RepID=UPI00307B3E3F
MTTQLDLTLDPLEEVGFRNKAEEWIRRHKFLRTTHFNAKELESLLYIYHKLQRDTSDPSKNISRFQLSTIFHVVFGMPDSILMPRIFHVIIGSAASTVPVTSWIKMMNIFLRGTLEEQIDYCFAVYDAQGRGELRRDQMMNLLRKMFFRHEEEEVEETVKDFVDIILNMMDLDKDGKISKADFKETVMEKPLMLECFGQCLPDRAHTYAFLTTFTDRIKRF